MAKSRLELLMGSISPEPNSGCWLWMRYCERDGYGQMHYRSGAKDKAYKAHRVAYEEMVGAIPDGMVIDHKCRVRCCVNPDHLEAVTQRENLRRGIYGILTPKCCPQGHPFDQVNTIRDGRHKYRHCRICVKACKAGVRKRKSTLKVSAAKPSG